LGFPNDPGLLSAARCQGFDTRGAKPPSKEDERKEFLRDLFREQLKEKCGFEYVTSVEMVNKQGHSIHFLFSGRETSKASRS
jgi:hypothetical protein